MELVMKTLYEKHLRHVTGGYGIFIVPEYPAPNEPPTDFPEFVVCPPIGGDIPTNGG